jgi:hypothetical protein
VQSNERDDEEVKPEVGGHSNEASPSLGTPAEREGDEQRAEVDDEQPVLRGEAVEEGRR